MLIGCDCLISFESVKDVFGVVHGHKPEKWRIDCGFMNSNATIRIKPRKEKRWIAHFKVGDKFCMTQRSYETIDKLKSNVYAPRGFGDWQFIEIEIEV